MANGYNPMSFVTNLSGIMQQSGAQGLRWEGQQKGKSSRLIRQFLNEKANAAAVASRGLGLLSLLSKPAGWATQAAVFAKTGSVNAARAAGAAVSGGIQKFGGDREVDKLDTSGIDMSEILYNRDTALKADSAASSAINQLIEGVNPRAISTAITTPLQYETLQNVFNMNKPVSNISSPSASTPVTDASVREAMSKTSPVEFGYSDAVNPAQTNPGLILSELSRMGSMSPVSNVVESQTKPFSNLLSFFMRGMQSNNNLSTDPLEEELKMNSGQAYNNPGGIY